MERIRANSFCCGGGGGVMTGFTDWAGKNAGLRIQEGVDTGADKMISICPFCYFNLTEGTRRVSSKMSLHDLTELIDAALEE
jgi:Fe-S oxidoreductase